jgi:cbb3-type cytochrome oxidase subunit 3
MSQLLVDMNTSSLGWLGGGLTALFLASFLGWTWFAYSPANRARHEAAGNLPLEGDDR